MNRRRPPIPGKLERVRIGQPPRCGRCDDSGMVLLDQRIDDARIPAGRMVAQTYRCECAAGARYDNFPLAPPPGQELPPEPPRLRLLPPSDQPS